MNFSKTIFIGILISISLLALSQESKNQTELALPTGYNTLFAGSGECLLCHNSMIDNDGNNIGILNYWKSSMMANSSKDPFWRAKVSYEVIKNPALQEEIETTCTRCHAAQGSFNAFHNGQAHYSIEELYVDPIANDGVSCTVCHQILEESHGNFSGEIEFGDNHQIFGPYVNIFPNPMIEFTGYTPTYGTHIKDSELCANCHTLFTPTVDLNGQFTGTYFTEQSIYQEWKNSFAFETQTSCQDCHIPELNESIVISTMPPWLEGQSPFGKHELVGGNVFMLNMLKNNIDELSLTAGEQDFDATINRTLSKLLEESLILEIDINDRTDDTLFLQVSLLNMAGHKIPTGYPSRQIFLQLIVKNEADETIFISGEIDEYGQIIHEAFPFEPHHDQINSENQTQIYQMVMGNVEDNVTTTLLQADHALKDNRLVPMGFSYSHPSYDTTALVGEVLNDSNYNENQSGKDIIYYNIPVQTTGHLNIEVKAFYQSVNSRWLNDMFAETSEEIDSFENIYNISDLTPVLMKSATVTSQATEIEEPMNEKEFILYPNPVNEYFWVNNSYLISKINIYDLKGRLVKKIEKHNIANKMSLSVKPGVYLIEIMDKKGNQKAFKLIKN